MENKISRAEALKETKAFIDKYDGTQKDEIQIENENPQLLDAIEKGNLVFDEDYVPTLTLKEAIKNDEGDVSETQVKFKTRIKPSDLTNISKGMDVSKNQLKYVYNCYCHIIGQPFAMLDKYSKMDFKVIEQVCNVLL